jgi:heme-degrading monooxygenase HmoA
MVRGVHLDYGFLVIWRFRVRPGMGATFERIYGPQGDWARLFKEGEGYLRTELLHSQADPQVYVTLDFWGSRQAYDRFRSHRFAEYHAIDASCESVTESEVEVGRFVPEGN